LRAGEHGERAFWRWVGGGPAAGHGGR